jgi:hypothetical protein
MRGGGLCPPGGVPGGASAAKRRSKGAGRSVNGQGGRIDPAKFPGIGVDMHRRAPSPGMSNRV